MATSTTLDGAPAVSARTDDFLQSFRAALWWHIAAFALALLLVARLPEVHMDGAELTPTG